MMIKAQGCFPLGVEEEAAIFNPTILQSKNLLNTIPYTSVNGVDFTVYGSKKP